MQMIAKYYKLAATGGRFGRTLSGICGNDVKVVKSTDSGGEGRGGKIDYRKQVSKQRWEIQIWF